MSATVCIFFPAIGRGGLEKALVEISRGLCEEGFRVILFYLKSKGEVEESLDPRVVKWRLRLPAAGILFNHRFLTALALAAGWLRFLVRQRPDCVIGFQSSSTAIPWARVAGVPFVHRESSDCRFALSRQKGWLRPYLVACAKRLTYRHCHAIVANSAGSAASLSEMAAIPHQRIQVIYNPIDFERIKTLAQEPADPAKWFDGGLPVVMAMGRLAHEKNHAELLQAFRRVARRMPAKLVIAGEGGLRAKLERDIDSLGLKDDVKLIGHLANPYPYLRKASVFALPSLFEGLPNCLLEAAALGVPSVSYDCPSGPREILMAGKAGRLVPVGDIDGLAEALAELISDRRMALSLVENARAGLDRYLPARAGGLYGQIVRTALDRARPAVAGRA